MGTAVKGKKKNINCNTCGAVMEVSAYAGNNQMCLECKKKADPGLKISPAKIKRITTEDTQTGIISTSTGQEAIDNWSKIDSISHDDDLLHDEYDKFLLNRGEQPKIDMSDYILIDDHIKQLKEFVDGFEPDVNRFLPILAIPDGAAPFDPVRVSLRYNRGELEATIITPTGTIERIPAMWKPINFDLDYLSVSKIKKANQCLSALLNDYMLVTDPSEGDDNQYSWLGTICHDTCEAMEDMFMKTGMIMCLEKTYKEIYAKYCPPETDLGLEKYEEGLNLVKDHFRRNPINQNRPYRVIAVEPEFRGKLGDAHFGAKIDLIAIYKEKIDGKTVGLIKDYKSNRQAFTRSQLDNSLQMKAYEAICRIWYPEVDEWRTGYEMFRFGWQPCRVNDDVDIQNVLDYISSMWHMIKNAQTFPATLNNLCPWCSGKAKCRKYNSVLANPTLYLQSINLDASDIDTLYSAKNMAATVERIAGDIRKQANDAVRAAIEQNTIAGKPTVLEDGKQLILESPHTDGYDSYKLFDAFFLAGEVTAMKNMVTIKRNKVEQYLDKNPEFKFNVMHAKKKRYNAPQIREV